MLEDSGKTSFPKRIHLGVRYGFFPPYSPEYGAA
jgi:hypothetical protein